ncbi:unnamed protein product [Urochloa humidicola]
MAKEASWEVDRLSALPDDILQHVLSFLPSVDVADTMCLVARRWRNLWRSTPALRIRQSSFCDVEDANDFANHLLLLRDHTSPLLTCEIKGWDIDCVGPLEFEFDMPWPCRYIGLWIQYALKHQDQVLRVTTSRGAST